jgi:hypothetical protein
MLIFTELHGVISQKTKLFIFKLFAGLGLAISEPDGSKTANNSPSRTDRVAPFTHSAHAREINVAKEHALCWPQLTAHHIQRCATHARMQRPSYRYLTSVTMIYEYIDGLVLWPVPINPLKTSG